LLFPPNPPGARCASAGGYQHKLGCQEREENLTLLTRDGIA